MDKELESLIARCLADISSPNHRALLEKALYEAIATSEITKLYIPYVLKSPGFKMHMDAKTPEQQIPSIAHYETIDNQIVVFKNAIYWKVAKASDVSRVLLHEFLHAYLVILHTPSDTRLSPGEKTLLARPLAFSAIESSNTRKEAYDTLEKTLDKDLRILAKILSLFLRDRENFHKQYPKLSSYLVELSERYIPKTESHILPPLQPGESCDAKYEKSLKEIEKAGQTTQMIDEYPYIAKAIYERGPGRCGVIDHIGNTKWDTLSIKLFELYSYILNKLLTPKGFNTSKQRYLDWYLKDHRFDYPNPPNQEQLNKMEQAATELAFGEWLAQTSEIGPFFELLQGTMRMLNKDYISHLPAKYERNAFRSASTLPPEIREEFLAVVQIKYREKTSIEIIATIDEQQGILRQDANAKQIDLGARLYALGMGVTPILPLGQLLLDTLSPPAIEAANNPLISGNSALNENEDWNMGQMAVAATVATVLVASAACIFWNSRRADSTQQQTPEAEPKHGKGKRK